MIDDLHELHSPQAPAQHGEPTDGGVPTAEITIDGVELRYSVPYFHGGVYVLGDAFLAAALLLASARRRS